MPATYQELYGLRADSDLQEKVAVAAVKKAQTLLDLPSPTTAQVSWALGALRSPRRISEELLNYVLAKNSTLEVAQIQGAGDSAIQSNVDDAVDAIIAGTA